MIDPYFFNLVFADLAFVMIVCISFFFSNCCTVLIGLFVVLDDVTISRDLISSFS
jgi:hypothetical protein